MNKKIIFLLASSLFTAFFAKAQLEGVLKPTSAETKVIEKTINIVAPIINGLENSDWEKTAGGAVEEQDLVVATRSGVMGMAPFYDWHFEVRNGSERYIKIAKPYIDKVTANPPDANNQKQMEEYINEGDKVKAMVNVYIKVMVNLSGIPVKPAKGAANDLKITGSFFSYHEPLTGDKTIGMVDHGKNSYVLAFGNWGSTKFTDNIYQFHFTHPVGTPYIENIVILIYGAPDRVQEILLNTDWKKINEGLTL